jgi:hypothetical protein
MIQAIPRFRSALTQFLCLPPSIYAVFFRPAFLTADPARFTAHLRFIASASRLRPSGVNLGLRLTGVAAGVVAKAGATSTGATAVAFFAARFFAAHRLFSAATSRAFPSAVIPPLRVAGASAGFVSAGAPVPSTSRSAVSEQRRRIDSICREEPGVKIPLRGHHEKLVILRVLLCSQLL